MTFTYSSTSISTDLAKVRLRIGDTTSDDALLTDEEINHFLGLYTDVDQAAIACIRAILASPKTARAVDRSGTGFSATRSQRFQHLKDLLEMLEKKARSVSEITLTGTTASEKTSLESDSDYNPTEFYQGMHTNEDD